ncbi:MAG: SpoIID/LytB domain-containing protein [Scytolyngbya sp. HA4215-MV1]|jgi:stage II sporulation protein D|nr:SpoIID/LytB domain-containing protein [Scytolyngbya sp. HA4215-MV1]
MALNCFPKVLLTQLQRMSHLGRRYWWLSAIVWLVMAAPAQAALDLRVAIEEGASQIRVGSSTKAVVTDGTGNALGEIEPMNAFDAQLESGKVAIDRWHAGEIWIQPSGDGYVWIGDRWYRGRVLVVPSGNGLTAVNYVDLEQYLYSVLGAEMSCNWPLEALKAQAVAARSYALKQRQSAGNGMFDLGDTAAWQVYGGIEKECTTTQAAVNATEGQVLTYNGQIIEAVFHSSSGGYTENVEDIWVQALPYLRAVPDFDQGTPVFQWTVNFSRSELSQKISGVGNIISLTPERTTPHGRIITMKVVGDAGSRNISGESLRSALGLKSTLFEVVPQYGSVASAAKNQQPPIAFQIIGRGFGHGLGMSQWGAYNLAQKGFNYQQIVLHYYKGSSLAKIQVR